MSALPDIARTVLPLLDLTRLEDNTSDSDIARLCARASTAAGHVAAVCVAPEHVGMARQGLARAGLHAQVKVATVINFPHGQADPAAVEIEARSALTSGADEIDLVFDYRALIDGDERAGYRLVSRCRQIMSGYTLKVILETGELKDSGLIRTASDIAISAGADFLKTSTGKVAVNATPGAAAVMMEAIRDSARPVGFKAAGGIGTTREAGVYLDLARHILGKSWLRPERFRFGASSLLDDLLQTLELGVKPVDLRSRYEC
ncbi:MAG: deoxyribose-phosphate aldolase [Wenzhouxiangella sp.]|nr:MAG: deoxyribose-phosphate aldolase [Wenzhouxiangella sp.]